LEQFIITVNILLAFKLAWDWYAKNKQKMVINHAKSAFFDGFVYVVAAWFSFGLSGIGWVIVAVGYRWIMFDILFNLINGDKWNHYGNSAWTDKQLKKLGKWHLIPKIGVIIIGIILIKVI
jgi:hypothetical protein